LQLVIFVPDEKETASVLRYSKSRSINTSTSIVAMVNPHRAFHDLSLWDALRDIIHRTSPHPAGPAPH